MNRYLLDINAVLAVLDPRHVFHEAAHAWVAGLGQGRWLTCPLVQNGVIRVASQSRYPNHLGTPNEARAVLADFCADARHEFCPDDVSLLDARVLQRPDLLTPSRVTDLYLLALARKHGARLATFDSRVPAEAIEDGRRHLCVLAGEAG